MYKKALTDVKIRSLKEKDKLYNVMDGDGLMLRVAVSGTKTWIHRYKIHKKTTVHTLGHYPTLSISKARRMRDDNKVLTRQKIHPKSITNNSKNNTMTNKHTDEGPFLSEFEKDLAGVVLREMITYRYRDGMMIKETVTRRFKKGGDYHDTTMSTPMPEIK